MDALDMQRSFNDITGMFQSSPERQRVFFVCDTRSTELETKLQEAGYHTNFCPGVPEKQVKNALIVARQPFNV